MEILLKSEERNASCTVWVGGDSDEGGMRESKGERISAGKQEV